MEQWMQSLPTAASEGGLHFVDPVISPPLKPTFFPRLGVRYMVLKNQNTSLVTSEEKHEQTAFVFQGRVQQMFRFPGGKTAQPPNAFLKFDQT